MRRSFTVFLILALLLALVPAVLAEEDVTLHTTVTKFVSVEKAKVYAEHNKDAEVIKEVRGGDKLSFVMMSKDEAWYGALVEDTKNGGQMLGWILANDLSDTLPQSFCKHDWDSWTVEREATCQQEGYRYRVCRICGLREEDAPAKLAHDFSKWKVTREATCVKKGERTRTCRSCGKEEKEEFLADHDFGSWKTTKEPSCTEKGERTHTCKVCGKEVKEELDKLPHDYERRIITEATDHSAGIRAKICKVCGHNGGEESFDPEGTLRRKDRGEEVRAMQQLLVEQGYLNEGGADGVFGGGTEKALKQYQQDRGLEPDGVAWPQTLKDLQHDFGPWTTVQEMTRVTAGERVRVCQGCGFEQHEAIESGTVFERGRRGEDVRALQQIIKQVGYDAGSFDGIYGKKLDAAMASFASDRGLVVEEGRIRPADIDAVMNAWLKTVPADTWKGEGDVDSPVDLALTVTETEQADESGITTYSWSLTNLGSEKAMFNALLLTFGDEPDFTDSVLVMALDGFELKRNAKNSVSGSFSADSEWGEGDMHFAAMAVSEGSGDKWLSNTVSFENASAPAAARVAPLAEPLDMDALPDGVYPVSFERGDVLHGASGVYMNAVHVYTEDWYDLVEVDALKEGDTFVAAGEEVPVASVERDEYGVTINAGQDEDCFLLAAVEDANGYRVFGDDDRATYTEQGVTTLVVDPSATFTDGWDIEKEPVTVGYDGIAEAMQASDLEYFDQYNTTVRLEGGKVVEIVRSYVP